MRLRKRVAVGAVQREEGSHGCFWWGRSFDTVSREANREMLAVGGLRLFELGLCKHPQRSLEAHLLYFDILNDSVYQLDVGEGGVFGGVTVALLEVPVFEHRDARGGGA